MGTALIVGAAVFLIVWFLRSMSTALAMGAAAALFTWITSAWLQGKTIVALVVGVAAACGVWKLLGGKFLALAVGGVVARRIFKLLQMLEEEEEEEKRASALVFGAAAGVAALAAWGISRSFDGGSDGERSRDKEKMMKAPGRGIHMRRKDFEDNPCAYFRGLRGKEPHKS